MELDDCSRGKMKCRILGKRFTNLFVFLLQVYLVVLSAAPVGAQSVSAPSISPGTGIYFPGPTVTLSAVGGANIFYTLDGSVPNSNSDSYSSPFTVNGTTTVKAIAVSGGTTSTVATADLVVDPTTQVMENPAPVCWFRSDVGITADSSNKISSWLDSSGNGYDATQSSSGSKPSVVFDDYNDFASVTTGSGSFFNLSSGFSNLNPTVYFVTKPLGTTNGYILDIGNGNASDNLTASTNDTDASFTIYSGSTPSSITAPGSLTLGKYQMLSMSANGYVAVNGIQQATGSLQPMNTIDRTENHIGADYSGASNLYEGGLLEVFLYDASDADTDLIDLYMLTRYQLLNATPAAPLISVGSTTLDTPTQVAIATPPNCVCKFTTDGSTPTATSTTYTGPINVSYSQTLQAIAFQNGAPSSVASAVYTLDSSRWPAPNPSDTTPLQINLQSPTD
jgi:hypothetical protein